MTDGYIDPFEDELNRLSTPRKLDDVKLAISKQIDALNAPHVDASSFTNMNLLKIDAHPSAVELQIDRIKRHAEAQITLLRDFTILACGCEVYNDDDSIRFMCDEAKRLLEHVRSTSSMILEKEGAIFFADVPVIVEFRQHFELRKR
jgi:hypothetical protein